MKVHSLLAASAVAFLGVLVLAGCETEPAGSSDLKVSPSSARLKKGESASFTASGGYDYSWTLATPEYGSLSANTGARVTYTSEYEPSTNTTVTQTLTVNSTIDGSGADTNGTGYLKSREVLIVHVASNTSSSTLSISPSSTSISNGQSRTLTASGGTGSYTWSLRSEDWGFLDKTTGNKVSYTSQYTPSTSTNTYQLITVTSGSESAYAYVRHVPSTFADALSITYSDVTLGLNDTATFTASGGSGTYAWSIANSGIGTLSAGSGSTATYVATSAPTNVVTQTLTLSSGSDSVTLKIFQAASY